MTSIARIIGMAGIVVGLGIGAAAAQGDTPLIDDTCGPHRAAILSLADRIISERVEAERFTERHFGTAAAYLILRYGDMDLASGFDLLARIRGSARRAPRDLENLQLAFAISKLGVDRGLETDGRPAVEIVADLSPIVMRQLLLADAGESFLRLLTAVRADPELAENFEARYFDGLGVHHWVLDQSDDFKRLLARNAEAAGELELAAVVLASRRNLSEYHALLERHEDTSLEDRAGPRSVTFYTAAVLHQANAPPVPGEDAESREQRDNLFQIMRASFRMGGAPWLSILYNQSGADAPIARASRDFLAEIEAGRLNPGTELEPGWTYLYDRLAQEMGADALARYMGSFSLRRSVRHYAETAQVTMDWIQARQALILFLTGRKEQLPPRPPQLSPKFDWSAWTALATALRRGDAPLVIGADADARIVPELLFAKGDLAGALDIARDVLSITDRLWFYRDVMLRLDRRCDGYTNYPGAELVLSGDIFYRFD